MAGTTRRTALAGCAALLACRGRAAAETWDEVSETARGLEQLHALVVLRHGREVLADRRRGPALDVPVNVKSVSKTVLAALTGAAIDRGYLPGVAASLGAVAPGLIPRGAPPGVAEITLEDLLTMRAGLERTSGRNYGAWVASRNWVADALSRPFVAEPGGRMLYSTGSYHVLGAVLAEATGRSLLALARDWLGDPLDLAVPPWTRDPQGRYLGGNQMALSPRGMARFGEMYRQGGLWAGARVLPAAWIAESFVPRGRSPWSGLGYGYGWFLGRLGGVEAALARGYGGQVIAVLPGIGVTVAITSDPDRPARSRGYFGDLTRLIGARIVPAARGT
jgi:CubicO group peptidase (beta-lactamase class C family)